MENTMENKSNIVIDTFLSQYYNIMKGYITNKITLNNNIKNRILTKKFSDFIIYNEDSGYIIAKYNVIDGYVSHNKNVLQSFGMNFNKNNEDLGRIYNNVRNNNNNLIKVKIESKLKLIPNILSDILHKRINVFKFNDFVKTLKIRYDKLKIYSFYIYSECGTIVSAKLKEDNAFYTYDYERYIELGITK